MSELTKEYFEDSLKDLHKFLAGQFAQMGTKKELQALENDLRDLRATMERRFDEVNIRLDFIQQEIEDIRKRLEILSIRTKKDTNILSKEFLSIRQRVKYLEKEVKQTKAGYN